jgi:hypothetical protein
LTAQRWDVLTDNGLRVSRVSAGTGERSSLPFVSIILPTIGRPSLGTSIRTLLDSDYPRFELLVVHDIQRRGSAIGRNLGLRIANGDLIQFAEDDCRYTATNLRVLVEKYLSIHRNDPSCAGIVGSFLPAVWGSVAVMVHISTPGEGLKLTVVPGEGRTDYLATGNSLCSKRIILQCGGFNERYSHMFEDLELSLVLKKNGHRLYNCAQAAAEHRNEPRFEKSSRPLRGSTYLRARNAVLIHKSWCRSPVSYAARMSLSDLRRIAVNPQRAIYGLETQWRRTAERRPLLDRVAYLLGVATGLISRTTRQTIGE